MPKLLGFQQRKVSHSAVSLLRFNFPRILETLSIPLPNSVASEYFLVFVVMTPFLRLSLGSIDTVFITGNSLLETTLSEPNMTTWIVDISSHLSLFIFLFRLKRLTQTSDSEMATLTNTTFHF